MAELEWLQMSSGVSEKSPMRCRPEPTPDPDPEERLGLRVRYQSPGQVAEGYKGRKPCLSLYPRPLSFSCTFQNFVPFCFYFTTLTLEPVRRLVLIVFIIPNQVSTNNEIPESLA